MRNLRHLFDPGWWAFQWRYRGGRTPWDTNVTPPEVMGFLESAPPGRALDLGCGTGTNAIAMARRGWQVTGVDFVARAIRDARRKAGMERLVIDFRVDDVTRLRTVDGIFDYALDIGCLHSLTQDQQQRYASGLPRLLRPGGTFMLYAWLPRISHGKRRGIATETVHGLFDAAFHTRQTVIGEEAGAPSAWYWFVRRSFVQARGTSF